MTGLREPVWQVLRFGTVGLWATVTYLIVAAGANAAGTGPQLANVLGYGVATVVSFLGHFHWTFGKRANQARALARFLVVAAGGFLLSASIMLAAAWLHAPFWAALAAVITLVPALTWLSGRYWAFK